MPDCLNTPTTLPHETTFQRINRLADLQKKTHYARLRRLVDQHAKRHPDVLAGEALERALESTWWADWEIWNKPGVFGSRYEEDEVFQSIAEQCPNRPKDKDQPIYIQVEIRPAPPRSWRHDATLKELRETEKFKQIRFIKPRPSSDKPPALDKTKPLKLAAEHELPDWDEWMAPYAKY